MSLTARLALRFITNLHADQLTAAELDLWAPALQDASARLQGERDHRQDDAADAAGDGLFYS